MLPFKSKLTQLKQHYTTDSLRRNSMFLIMSQVVSSGAGFLFWVISAHLFTPVQIGTATAIVSFGALVATFTNLGLPNTVLRFLPTSKSKGGLFSSSLALILATSAIGSFVSLLILHSVATKLSFIQSSVFYSAILVLLVVATSLSSLMDSVLLSARRSGSILIKATSISFFRLLLPFFLFTLALRGLISIYVLTYFVGIFFSFFVAFKYVFRNQSLRPKFAEISTHRNYAISNYFGAIFGILPGTLVPLIIFTKLGATQAAYFYMPVQIATFLGILSSSVAQALISEASQQDNQAADGKHFANALKHLYSMLVPAVVALILLGWPVLRAYGPAYAANGFVPLVILAMASLFIGLNWLGDTWLNIKQRHLAYFIMNALNALVVVGSVYLFSSQGLTAAALGWLIGQAISAAVYLGIFARDQLVRFARTSRTSS